MADSGEADIVNTGLRELTKETGFTAEHALAMPPLSADAAKFRDRPHLVLAYDAVRNRAPQRDAGEEFEVVRVSVSECLDMVRLGRFVNAAHMGMLLMGLERAGLLRIAASGHCNP